MELMGACLSHWSLAYSTSLSLLAQMLRDTVILKKKLNKSVYGSFLNELKISLRTSLLIPVNSLVLAALSFDGVSMSKDFGLQARLLCIELTVLGWLSFIFFISGIYIFSDYIYFSSIRGLYIFTHCNFHCPHWFVPCAMALCLVPFDYISYLHKCTVVVI